MRVLGVALLVLWTLHTVVITGKLMLDGHYAELIAGHPQGALRAPLNDLIQDATPGLVDRLPSGAVLVLVDRDEIEGFAYFWLTYWFYPRHVDVTADLSLATTTRAGSIVYFQRPSDPDLPTPSGYQLQSDTVSAGGGHVLVFVRSGA